MSEKILGIDEAGRGCILGSMFLCGLFIKKEEISSLEKLEIHDSKFYGSNKKAKEIRKNLSQKLKKTYPFMLIEVPVSEIDFFVRQKGLNKLERKMAKKIIANFSADKVILDGKNIFKSLQKPHIKAIDKADKKNKVVAAASIVAKDARDNSLENLLSNYQKNFGTIKGNGYINQGTFDFLSWYIKKFRTIPSFYRKSFRWKAFESRMEELGVFVGSSFTR